MNFFIRFIILILLPLILFSKTNNNNDILIITGDKNYSPYTYINPNGYKKSDSNFEFKEHVIPVKEGMQFYISTDGYFDQNEEQNDDITIVGFEIGDSSNNKKTITNSYTI